LPESGGLAPFPYHPNIFKKVEIPVECL